MNPPFIFNNLEGFIMACRSLGLTVIDRGGDILVWAQGGDISERHIHIFFELGNNPPHRISGILPKSGALQRPELAGMNTVQWQHYTAHLHQNTRESLDILRRILERDGVGY